MISRLLFRGGGQSGGFLVLLERTLGLRDLVAIFLGLRDLFHVLHDLLLLAIPLQIPIRDSEIHSGAFFLSWVPGLLRYFHRSVEMLHSAIVVPLQYQSPAYLFRD